jgi:lactate 2-monooxygenase
VSDEPTATQFANFQLEVYLAGATGARPTLPMTYVGLERRAREVLSPGAYGYVAGGAGGEDTVRANAAAFRTHRIVPRMLREVGTRDLSLSLLGTRLPAPVLLAPVGVLSIVHPAGELAAARAAAGLGIPYVLSTAASNCIEDVAAAMGDGPRWYQLYWPPDEELARSFLRRAEDAGYAAVVVTLDTPTLAWRPRDLQLGYLPFLKGEGIANYLSDPVFRSRLAKPPEEDLEAAIFQWAAVFGDLTHTWPELGVLREATRLPILLKGVLHPDDARRALDQGVDGLIVSNHGGRQVDRSVGALDALPGVVRAVAGAVPVLFDSGIRSGADAFQALALGAEAVLLGRPYVWGLALAGEEGVRHVLRCVLAELDLTMALTGCASLAEVDRELLDVGN